jgi:uncharacterized protein with NAD-binding domain and iron-sulfur cluster
MTVGADGPRVLVLGGGVGGLSAAHELMERGFRVTVLEGRGRPGGKARSVNAFPAPPGRSPLPGEHGFRFFPGFYQHLPDVMRRIPFGSNKDGVLGNLVACDRFEFARTDGPALVLPTHPPASFDDLKLDVSALRTIHAGLGDDDLAYFLSRILVLLTSCEERRYQEWEYTSWWEFSGAKTRSAPDGGLSAYQKYLAGGLTRCFVAARPELMSARTGGYVGLRLEHDELHRGHAIDRVLNGPTYEQWIEPWLEHLTAQGVDIRCHTEVHRIEMDGKRVGAVVAEGPEGLARYEADYYVSALPVEQMRQNATGEGGLVTAALMEAEPRLAELDKLQVNWMNGIQLYLRNDQPIVNGHTVFADAPWSLTGISQAQFWRGIDLTTMGDGDVRGILSIDISSWHTLGFNNKKAIDCEPDEIYAEVLEQVLRHRGADGAPLFDKDDVVRYHLDHDIEPLGNSAGPSLNVNLEPLLVNTVGSWVHRPPAVLAIENLFLASDYVQTYTDLASMEGANEAARRAVNGILEAAGSSEAPCEIWRPAEPAVFAPLRAIDRARFKLGQKHHMGPGGPPQGS